MKTHATPTRDRQPTPAPGRSLPRPATRNAQRQRAAVHEIIHTPRVQPKLTIGPPDDAYEREADRVADAVMRMPDPDTRIQRMCPECEEELQRQPVDELEEGEEQVRAKSSPGEVPEITDDVAAQIQALRGGGRPLTESARSFFEPRFGADFSQVRIHDDGRASEMARSINARAFTVGRDIVFGRSEHAPETSAGKKLLAHELTHVVQQRPASQLGKTDRHRNTRGQGRRHAGRQSTTNPHQSVQTEALIQREITEGSIRGRNGDFFSTNCGWVDTGHANPADARTLIAQVREASHRTRRREEQLRQTLLAERTPLLYENDCNWMYEENERTESTAEMPVMESTEHRTGAVDIVLSGFGVDSSDSQKFGTLVDTIARSHASWSIIRGVSFAVQVLGFSDCVGAGERNNRLRVERAASISLGLARHGIQVDLQLSHGVDQFLASNATRAGRKKNRGVLIRLVPHVTPERFTTETAESRKFGIQVSGVTPTVELNRSLTEDEVLSVALTIFSAQSTAFEHLQQWRDVIPLSPPSSSFAEEDLPSNLIGFYRAARGFSIEEVRSLCDAWSEESSIAHLRGYTFRPNDSFSPQSLPPGGSWPDAFRTIAPAPLDSDAFQIVRLRLATPLFTIDCSVDSNTSTIQCR